MHIEKYSPTEKASWDAFVEASKNGTFLFRRDYMDYHADRFCDHSLMIYSDRHRLLALLPANISGQQLYSHQGLTYGGLILGTDARADDVLQIFQDIIAYLRALGITAWHYKQMPTIYHRCPAEEDEYALWRCGAQLETCLISTTIPLTGTLLPATERRRRRGMKRAMAAGLTIRYDAPLNDFWPIMVSNLMQRYGLSPVHTLDEMTLLQQRFPQNIRCHTVCDASGTALAGCVLYDCNDRVIHIQYGHATPEGKALGALDMLYLTLIDDYRKGTSRAAISTISPISQISPISPIGQISQISQISPISQISLISPHAFFDFGNSNEDGGHLLNHDLIAQKEGFGGRGIAYKTYLISIQ